MEMIEVPTAKTVGQRSERENEEMKPTMAARMMAGPTLFAGAVVYIMTARNMKASPTDLWVWLVPSRLVTATVNRLDRRVSTSRTMNGPSPSQPRIGSRTVDTIPSINIAVPIAATPPTSKRLFQFSFGIKCIPRISLGDLGLIRGGAI